MYVIMWGLYNYVIIGKYTWIKTYKFRKIDLCTFFWVWKLWEQVVLASWIKRDQQMSTDLNLQIGQEL